MLNEDEQAKYAELRSIVARLRAPDGCPWDREQTHASLRPYVIEEAFEVVAALDHGDASRLPEELGDLLFQILIHTQLAEEAREFTMADVLGGLAAKLIRRHPHVFGDVKLSSSNEVVAQWDDLKRTERAERTEKQSALAGVPGAMPALAYAQSLLRRAEAEGFAWPKRSDITAKVIEELQELDEARTPDEAASEFGDLLLSLTDYARNVGVDAEEALRQAGHKFRRRFQGVERRATAQGKDLKDLRSEQLEALWAEEKAAE
jgi:tetrapyrrole methylase family protein/MazG family protein